MTQDLGALSGSRASPEADKSSSPIGYDPARVERALEAFTEYFVRNYPGPHTIIGDPNWHAPKIFRAAIYAMKEQGL